MLKSLLTAALLVLGLPALAMADNEKIDPTDYVCAELLATGSMLNSEPPIFEILQIDGYVSADVNMDVSSPDTVNIMLTQIYNWCEKRPADKVIDGWRQMRATGPLPLGEWSARTSTCADYAANEEDGSGFLIWLDGYNRREQGTTKSILGSDKDVEGFIEACRKQPGKTMLEVLRERAK